MMEENENLEPPAEETPPAEEQAVPLAPETEAVEKKPTEAEAEVEVETEADEEEEVADEKAPGEPGPKNELKWFVIQTYSGQEEKVKKALEQAIEINKLQDKIKQVLVPTEEIVEIKGGKRTEKVRKMFPGYIFVEMALDEETWYKIRQTAGVARFIGTKSTPTPVSEREMQRVLKQLGKEEKLEITFEKGEAVRIISGAFRGYTGSIDEVNADKGKLKVLINIFGRDTPVEVNFEHAQKIV